MTRSSAQVTALVPTKNEAVNLERCLLALSRAGSVIVVDSGSTDGTVEIARKCDAEVVQFVYRGGYPKKRQWAIDNLEITTGWILLVDADEVVTPELWGEIECAVAQNHFSAFIAKKQFHFMGRRFRFGGFSHRAVVLIRKGAARFEQLSAELDVGLDMEVHERLIVDGPIGRLRAPLRHEDFKGLEAYIDRHNRYSSWEAAAREEILRQRGPDREILRPSLTGDLQRRRRLLKKLAARVLFEPTLWFLYHFVLMGGFLEGRRGLIASQMRFAYIAQVRAKMYERKLARIAAARQA